MSLEKIYTITDLLHGDGKFEARVSFDPTHPVFEGHFPGQPVVPGVVMVRIARDIAGQISGKKMMLEDASNIKFLNIVDPVNSGTVMLQGDYTAVGSKVDIRGNFSGEKGVYLKFRLVFVAQHHG